MSALLALALTGHDLEGQPVRASVWRALKVLVAGGAQPPEVAEWAKRNLKEADSERVTDRLGRIEEAELRVEELGGQGISVLTEFDKSYPALWVERLGDKAPPMIFVAGNPTILNEASLGIVGSREVDEFGSSFAAAVAAEASRLGMVTVSGGARGVDQTAMRAAYESGGSSLGVLSDSLRRATERSEARDALESGRTCLVSPFSPEAGFQVGNAMSRNKLIYAHSCATVVVASAEGSGGTWAGAVEALDAGWCTVLVRAGDGAPDGNRRLIARGGIALNDPAKLAESIDSQSAHQGSLF